MTTFPRKTLHWKKTWSYNPQNTLGSRKNQGEKHETLEKQGCQTQCFENHCFRLWTWEVGGWEAWLEGDDAREGIKSLKGVACTSTHPPPPNMRQSLGDNSGMKRGAWQRVTSSMPEILAPVNRSDSDDPCGGSLAKGDGSCRKMFAEDAWLR